MNKKIFLRRTLFFLMCMMVTSSMSALEVTIDGLVYELSGAYATVVHVAWGNKKETIEVPATIEYDGLSYTVNTIGEKAFCNYAGGKHYITSKMVYYNAYNGELHSAGVETPVFYWPLYYEFQYPYSYDATKNSYVTTVILPNTIETIGNGAFYNNNIISIQMQEGITSIGNYAFARTQMSYIHLPSSIQAIGQMAFSEMPKLNSIIIPPLVTKFGNDIFASCDLLRTIVYMGETPPTNWVATSRTYVPNNNYTAPTYRMNDAHIYTGHDWVGAAFAMLNWGEQENTFCYTGEEPQVKWLYTIEDYTPSFSATNLNTNVGVYSTIISVTFTKDSELFTTDCEYNYTITKVPLIVKVQDTNRTYGEDNPDFSCTYTGFVNNEDASVITTVPTITTTATADSDVGTYSITASEGVAQNYSFTYEDGTLTVLPAHLAVTVNDASRTYGDENPSFALTYSGLKNDEAVPEWTIAPTFTTDAIKTSDVGTYEIDVTAEPRNYTITTKQKGVLTVTQAPLTLKVDDATRPYYADDPEFTFTCAGFKNDDNVSVLTAQPIITPDAIKRSYVGTYDLNASDAEAKNYAITYEPGTLTITSRPLTVTPNSVSRPYGEPNPAFTCSYEGFVNNETEKVLSELPTVTTSATIGSNAGSYDLRVSGGKATNYTLSYQTGTLTVEPRELTISIGDYERNYGEDNPTFDIVYPNNLKIQLSVYQVAGFFFYKLLALY